MKAFTIILGVLLFAVTGVASAQLRAEPRPRLFPNQHLAQVGETRANQDIAWCRSQASNHVRDSRNAGDGLRAGARGATRGALMGTAAGAMMGNTGRGAATGAVVGVTGSAISGVSERGARDPVYQNFVNVCLEDKGYRVLEWR